MRVFSAIPLPDNLKDEVSRIMRGRLPLPYVNTTNLHITLNFFDELDTDGFNNLKELFPQPILGMKKFKIYFSKVTRFRHQIHVELEPNQQLADLQASMQEYYASRGFRFQDRAYYPHMKLANMHMDNVMNRQRKIEDFPNAELKQLAFEADRVILYESKLLLHHPKYIPLMEVPLK